MATVNSENDAPAPAPSAPRSGPLAGVRVLELGTIVAGPFAGRMLGDLGAEVLKLELPGVGDPLRQWGAAPYRGRSLWWAVQSRNKRLLTLNLRSERGQQLCRRLAAGADVLIENFKPGTMERWGLGPQELAEVNPGLVYARVSGYGQTGPYAPRAGFASAGEALGGLRHLNGYPGERPPRYGISLGDSLAALFAVQGILAALHHRDVNGGPGQVVDVSIMESCFALLESIVPEHGMLGLVREPTGTAVTNAAPSNLYRARDGAWVVIAANTDNLWQRLCAAVGRPEWLDDPRFASHRERFANMAALDALIGAWAAEHDADEIDRVLNAAGVVCASVSTVADLFADPHVAAREMIVAMQDPELGEIPAPGVFPKLSATPGDVGAPGAGELGADNAEVYGRLLGLDATQLAQLSAEGVV